MSTKVRDSSPSGRREEKKRTRSDKDRSEKKDRPHRSSSHRKSSTLEKTSSRTSLSSADIKKRSSMPETTAEVERPVSSESKSSLPYPNFSKAHSKEAVGSHPSLALFTPPATDVDISKESPPKSRAAQVQNGPPSPPLTDKNAGRSKTPATTKPRKVATIVEEGKEEGDEKPDEVEKNRKISATIRPRVSTSNGHLRSSSDTGANGSPTKSRERASTPLKKTIKADKPSQRSVSQPIKIASPSTSPTVTEVAANDSSDATSIAPEQVKIQRPGSKVLGATANGDVRPKSKPPVQPQAPFIQPIPHQQTPITQPLCREPTPLTQSFSRQQTPLDVIAGSPASQCPTTFTPGPPPPPPAPAIPIAIPKVDYLLHYGGLNQPIPKNLLMAGKPMAVQHGPTTQGQTPPPVIAHLFEPYTSLLEDFERVISKNGSLAVATGYRSVARRLLDRLEAVFARDISSQECECCMCMTETRAHDSTGVSWGEILELVSGRKDLPDWPPFAFFASPTGLGISMDMQAPMQKVDIDVPEEYREHYIRQSRKTKQSVDKWLSRQGDDPSSPPQEVDNETLTFAILTHLSPEQRQLFKDLLGIIDRPTEPPKRAPSPGSQEISKTAPTPQPRVCPPHINNASQAIQRLYRLAAIPRDAETGIFMLNNPQMHNALATLAAISSDEWDILISGRFDGFLRSGAEDVIGPPVNGRCTPARSMTGGHNQSYSQQSRRGLAISRQATPASAPQQGAPIALDEETEIAALAEIERDIYSGMEALEDAFEVLHQKAEAVRRAIRERNAGLSAAAQRRRGNSMSQVEIRMGTPASGVGERWESETDDGLGDWDGNSDIAPDDSASNISSSRRRRPKRRNERRTPAMIDEEDEDDYAESERSNSPRKR